MICFFQIMADHGGKISAESWEMKIGTNHDRWGCRMKCFWVLCKNHEKWWKKWWNIDENRFFHVLKAISPLFMKMFQIDRTHQAWLPPNMVCLYLDFSSTCILTFFIISSKSIRNVIKSLEKATLWEKSHFKASVSKIWKNDPQGWKIHFYLYFAFVSFSDS